MTDLVDELRKAHEAATAGKWQIMGEDTSSYIEILSPRTCVSITSKYLTVRNPNAGNDARFQALAHNSMPQILALFDSLHTLDASLEESELPGYDQFQYAVNDIVLKYRALKGETP